MVTMKIHVDGLKRMVAMRGGLSKVRASSQTTATMVHWFTMLLMQDVRSSHPHDLNRTNSPKSIFPPDERDDLSVDEPSKLYSIDPAPQYIPLDLLDIEDSVRALIERTRRISEHFASGQQGILETPDDFHWQFNSLLQRLCHLKIQSPPDSSTAHYTEACRHALALFLFLPFQNHYPDPRLVLNSFLHKLKFALKNIVPNLGSQSRFLLWLLAVGGVTALNVPERDWFVGHLVPVVAHLELRSWDAFVTALEGVVYIRNFLDGPFRELWEDVKFATEVLAEQDPYTNIILDSGDSRDSRNSRGSSSMPISEGGGDAGGELFVREGANQ
jgi:hypothetical protein